MSKKKIIILIIILIVLACLVWFFWPKESYVNAFFGPGDGNINKKCKCLGIEKGKGYTGIDTGTQVRYCYGMIYNCIEK
jgi:hypothetical protein